jgi:hypothetical protein
VHRIYRLFSLLVFFPLPVLATTAHYYTNTEFTDFEQKSVLEKIIGNPLDTEIVPPILRAKLKNKDLLSGHYVLKKPLYRNEILILADGPFYATVWRSGTNARLELQALAALVRGDQQFADALVQTNYQIIHLDVYTAPIQGKSQKVSVYQMPGFRLAQQNCAHLSQLLGSIGYPGSAFTCTAGTLSYIPDYSHSVSGAEKI